MQHFQLIVLHRYLNIYNKPAKQTIVIDVHGKKQECIDSLADSYGELLLDIAEDGTESFEFISIVRVIKTSL